MSRIRQLSLAVIDLGANWEACYRAALERLGNRARVVAVAGPAWKATRAAADSLAATHAASIRSMLRSPCDGVIMTDPGWYGWYPAEAALEAGRNLFLPAANTCEPRRVTELRDGAQTLGLLLVPEFRLRYTPATLRLRELLATDLGPIARIDIQTVSRGVPAAPAVLRELIDWCRVVTGRSPQSVSCRAATDAHSSTSEIVQLGFDPCGGREEPVQAVLKLPRIAIETEHCQPASAGTTSADTWPIEFSVSCKYGEARLEDAVHLRWRAGGQERIESLSTERTAVSVAVDHFARRLAGGLIPIPSLTDLLQAEQFSQLARASLTNGGKVLSCSVN